MNNSSVIIATITMNSSRNSSVIITMNNSSVIIAIITTI